LPIDPSGNQLISDISSATRQSLHNGLAIVAAASTTARVVKTTVFLRDLNDFAAMNDAYAAFFGDAPPARSTVQVARLPRDAVVEIEMIAAL
jgi:2-iminobutanoate/2-iminopropanoate deaminase